jgi:hypothetical protein
MKRRNFIATSALAGITPLAFGSSSTQGPSENQSLIEWRAYSIKFGGDMEPLKTFLNEIYRPALLQKGITQFHLFRDYGLEEPVKLYVLIEYPNASSYASTLTMTNDTEYQQQAANYNQIPIEQSIYSRFESWLLLGFEGFPTMADQKDSSELFELRTYEGYSEDAVRRKILMFNKEEIDLFLRVNLHPVFFGEMVAGPYRPCLTYMLQFKDMTERDANWKDFVDHPDWKKMVALPEYAHTVSNIRRQFLIRE